MKRNADTQRSWTEVRPSGVITHTSGEAAAFSFQPVTPRQRLGAALRRLVEEGWAVRVVRGRVEQGHVVLDESLPEGAAVAVIVAGDEVFDLNELVRAPQDAG